MNYICWKVFEYVRRDSCRGLKPCPNTILGTGSMIIMQTSEPAHNIMQIRVMRSLCDGLSVEVFVCSVIANIYEG